MNPEPHPDLITDWQATKKIDRGGRRAIEDEAITAYLKAWKATGDEDAAKEANRLVYSKYYRHGK